MFGINTGDIKRLEDDLVTFARLALPFATRDAIMSAAVQARKIAVADARSGLTLRNKFTVQSIQFHPRSAKNITLRVRGQEASVGSTADYMGDQEFGTTKAKKGKHGVALPTSYSSGEGKNARPRMRLPRGQNRLANIKLGKGKKKGSNRKQRNIIAIKQAAASGQKHVFLDLGKSKGIFRVTGGGSRIKMVHDMTNESVVIPKRPWLKPAFDEAARMIPAFYADALRFQLKRRGLFRNR